MSLRQWCTTNKDTIAAIGVLVATVGFVATGVGLGLTVRQIENTRTTLQATNAYQIQKDARELAVKLLDESLEAPGQPTVKLSDYLRQYSPEKYDKYDSSASSKLALIFNFYLSIFRQAQNDGVNEAFSKAFGRNFCNLFRTPAIAHYWDTRVQSSVPPSAETQEMKNAWCP